MRDSERKVKDKVYTTVAALVGIGLSVTEASKSVVEVGQGLFDRKEWKEFGDNSDTFDQDSMPENRNIRDKLRLIEAQSLSMVADEIIKQKRSGATITHTIASTTRKVVGTFVGQGVQVGQETPFPLPLMVIQRETTQDIAQQVDFVKKSYGEEVLEAVKNITKKCEKEVISLANLCLPELRTVLARQRRDYGISEDFPAQYPVEQQAANIDEAPVHNLDAERNVGKVDYRLKKIQSLEAVSRSLILQRAKDLREEKETKAFRTFKKEAEAKREVELAWSLKMKDKMKLGYSEKQIIGQIKERKRLDMMEALKINGGPFTDAGSVQNYLESVEVGDKEKQSRLKLELRFARESSTTLPQADQVFRIQVTMPNKKRRDKTANEFGESLMVYLGKKSDKAVIEYKKFKEALEKFTLSV